ncbi:MAG: hypothetical protein KJO09_11255 [Gammaproteobacteria bacterium]|nr:hypothetical protein [Gammaproteobacteria bacterium]
MLVKDRRIGGAECEAQQTVIQRVATRLFRLEQRSLACSLFVAFLILPSISLGSEPEIHRCTQEDGTIAFQEMPCPEPEDTSEIDSQGDKPDPAPADEFFDFVNPYDEAEQAPVPTEAARPAPPSKDRAECEKTTRDAIDAIDVELRKDYSEDASKAYLAELLELTRQLRACKQL